MYFGAHVKSSGGVWHAIENGVEIGAEAVQFFAGSPRTWAPTLYKDKDWQKFRELRADSPIRFVVIHTIYLINLASENEDFYEKSVTSLCGALTAADQLGADAIVTHIGSHQGVGVRGRPRARAGRPPARPRRQRGLAGAPAAREHGRRRRHHGRRLPRARPDHRRRRRRPAPRHLRGHGAHLRVRRRPAHARGHRRGRFASSTTSCGRERLVDAPPQRLQDAAGLQPRPAREHRRGRPRRGRLPHCSSTSRRSPACPASSRCRGSTARVRTRRTWPACAPSRPEGRGSRRAPPPGGYRPSGSRRPPAGILRLRRAQGASTRTDPRGLVSSGGASTSWEPARMSKTRHTDYSEVTPWNS